jgi:hypothetical protein
VYYACGMVSVTCVMVCLGVSVCVLEARGGLLPKPFSPVKI